MGKESPEQSNFGASFLIIDPGKKSKDYVSYIGDGLNHGVSAFYLLARGQDSLSMAELVGRETIRRYNLAEYSRDIGDDDSGLRQGLITLVRSPDVPDSKKRVIFPWLRFLGITITRTD